MLSLMNATSETPEAVKAELEILRVRADLLKLWHRALIHHIERLEGGDPCWRRPDVRNWSYYDKEYTDMMERVNRLMTKIER
jgi:hypothetical protein